MTSLLVNQSCTNLHFNDLNAIILTVDEQIKTLITAMVSLRKSLFSEYVGLLRNSTMLVVLQDPGLFLWLNIYVYLFVASHMDHANTSICITSYSHYMFKSWLSCTRCVSTSVSIKPLNIFNEMTGHFPALFVETEPGTWRQNMMFAEVVVDVWPGH